MSPLEELELLKKRALELAAAKEQYLRDHRLELFEPSPKQWDFIRAAAKKRRGCFAGNRFGKSTIGTVEDCSWLLGERPYIAEGDPLRREGIPSHGVKGLVIAEDWDKVREIFTDDSSEDRLGKFFYYLPRNKISNIKKTQTGVVCQFTVTNRIDGRDRESILTFETVKTFKNSPNSLESGDYDFIHGDEPFPEQMWKAVSRGLIDRNGAAWFLLTPLMFPWIYDACVEGAAANPDVWWWMDADMDDNPLLSAAAKELFLSQLSESERECRKSGKPLAYGRLVYPHFNKSKHLWNVKERGLPAGWEWRTIKVGGSEEVVPKPPNHYFCGYSIDPHPQTPHAVLFTAIAPTGQVFFFHERFKKSTISELALYVHAVLAGCHVGFQLCDPIAWNEDPETGKCWADSFIASGLDVQEASKQKSSGIIRTDDLFASDRKVYVLSGCVTFLSEISKYFFDRDDKPIDKDDHLMECMYRTVIHDDLQWHPRESAKPLIHPNDEFRNVQVDFQFMSSIPTI